MPTVLALKGVWKVYRMDSIEVPALKGLDMKVEEGEFVSVMGASGSGKSTALNIMGCLDSPTRGKVFLDGVDITALPESQIARMRGSKIGFVFQAFNLHPTLNVFENICLPMRIHEFPQAQIKRRADELIGLVGLSHRESHYPSQLSGGEKQRVAIARALSTSPSMVLADEPTGNLDSRTSHEIMGLLSGLHKEGKTIVVVTHERDIASYAQRTITIRDGKALSARKRGGESG
ncbi:MAG TPA: ABC transporter ATP-binding protein [Candidatus Diapherotrites archaeon]|uniref:ABC transporter ATP-binding protein n=1 Tax=Candidatus Iainarchaeum sp. TaxID=3101447 RepID=A0A7J4IY63_9ARCH|nr:ABC transporter ATP-binding protein [Candidatus Diapherotrites archaeon]